MTIKTIEKELKKDLTQYREAIEKCEEERDYCLSKNDVKRHCENHQWQRKCARTILNNNRTKISELLKELARERNNSVLLGASKTFNNAFNQGYNLKRQEILDKIKEL